MYEDVKTKTTFIIGLLSGDRRSNDVNHSPDPDNFTRESGTVNIEYANGMLYSWSTRGSKIRYRSSYFYMTGHQSFYIQRSGNIPVYH